MRQGQGQGRGAERGHLHAGLGCGATWGRLPSLGAWQRAALAACGDGRGFLCRAERPVQSILTFSCVLYRGGPARELPCGSGWGRWQNTLYSGLNAEFSLATSKEHPLPTPGPS